MIAMKNQLFFLIKLTKIIDKTIKKYSLNTLNNRKSSLLPGKFQSNSEMHNNYL